MHKRICALFFAVLLAFAFVSCGKAPQPEQPQPSQPESAAVPSAERAAEGDIASPDPVSQTTASEQSTAAASEVSPPAQTAANAETGEFGPLFQKYVRDLVADGAYTISMRQSGMTMVTAVSGKNSALESNVAGVLQIRLINQDGQYYMLMESTKKYAEMTAEDYAKQADSMQNAALDLSGVHYKDSGVETIAGKTYKTETYDENGRGSVTYYFTDAGLARARVVKDGKTNDVESFTVRDDADETLFRIPSDYVKVSDPSQLFT